MDPKLAYGLARQDFRRLDKAATHDGKDCELLLASAKKAFSRPKLSRDEAKSLFSRFRSWQEGTAGHVITHVYANPTATPTNGRFDSLSLTIHGEAGKKSFGQDEENVVNLYANAVRVTRQSFCLLAKPMNISIRHHALARYYERLHGRRDNPDFWRDIALGACLNLSAHSSEEAMMRDPVKPLVIPTPDGAFLGICYPRMCVPKSDYPAHVSIIEDGTLTRDDRIPNLFPYTSQFWVNTYLHDNDLTAEQRGLLGRMREACSANSRPLLIWYAATLFGDRLANCVPGRLEPGDCTNGQDVAGWLARLREEPGWGSMVRTVRDGRFRGMTEEMERFMRAEAGTFLARAKVERSLADLKQGIDKPAPFAFGR